MCDSGMSFAAAEAVVQAERSLLAAMDELRAARSWLAALSSDPSLTPQSQALACVGGLRANNLATGAEVLLQSLADLCQEAGETQEKVELAYSCK